MFNLVYNVLKEELIENDTRIRFLTARITATLLEQGYLKIDLQKVEALFESIKQLKQKLNEMHLETKN